MKVSRRYAWFLHAIFVSLGMSFAMSLVLTLVNLGLAPEFFERWARAFLIGFVVSLPASMIIIPVVRRIGNKLTE